MKPLIGLALAVCAISCGPQQVTVSGEITHKFEIDMTNLEKYFRALCEQEQSQDIDTCVTIKTAQFLEFMIDSSN